jgi:Cd2+/Zn2+-exporting ATPase
VAVGEIVLVRPGEKIAVDGQVIDGASAVNQAPITGESMPVDKAGGDEVFAGSINGQGALRVQSSRPAGDTTLARVIHAVEEAQASRAPSQTFVDRFARVYTPAVVGIATLIAIVPPLVGLGDWGTWVYRALTMLVVACPCALVISTPVTIVSGLTGAARVGVLIKGGAHLENTARVTTVAFDKTGTLTRGVPTVTDVRALGGLTEADVLQLAAAVERHSDIRWHAPSGPTQRHDGSTCHRRPTSRRSSVAERARRSPARSCTSGTHDWPRRWVRRVRSSPVTWPDSRKKAKLQYSSPAPGTVRHRCRCRPAAPEAPRALDALREAGVRRMVMLTGDNRGTPAP